MIDWEGVKALLDSAATTSRQEVTIDAAMDVYNAKVIQALQLLVSTASVDGSAVVNGGAVPSGGGPVTGANITQAKIT